MGARVVPFGWHEIRWVLAMRVASALTLALITSACSSSSDDAPAPSPAATPPAAEAPKPTNLEKTACRFTVPTSLEGKTYDCYDLVVPENRSQEGSRTIKVHAIRFRGKPGGTPTIELNGGPGAPSESLAVDLALGNKDSEPMRTVARFLEFGDYVLVDQRGVGRSIPRLGCTMAELEDYENGLTKCRTRHQKAGVDLTGYVTRENADDIHEIMLGLGATKMNLHAISYGSRLALEIFRRHGSSVAGTIIDGVMPAQAKVLSEGDVNYETLFARIFAACANDSKCNLTYPNLDKAFSDAKKKLDAEPFVLDGQPYDFLSFVMELEQNLYADGFAGEVPGRITRLLKMTQSDFAAEIKAVAAAEEAHFAEQDKTLAATELGREVLKRGASDPDPDAAGMAEAMFQSVVCSDYAQYESIDEALALEAKIRPELRNDDSVYAVFDACKGWPTRPKADDVFAPVASDLPVLAVAGVFDPVTPPTWRDLAASTLSKSQKATMGGGAHGALDPCGMGIKMGFLGAPEAPVDAACAAAQTIQFVYDAPKNLHRRALQRVVTKAPLPISPGLMRARFGAKSKLHLIPRAR